MIIGKLPEAELFALAGGGALIARGDVDRQTRDLDFFGPDPAGVDKLVPAVERALHEAGMNIRRVREGRGFFRLEVREYEEVTEVDLGADARLLPIERGELGPILAGEELAIDKVLAVFGRAEARDFVDLSEVADRYGLVHLCISSDARPLQPTSTRWVELPEQAYERLVSKVDRWRGVLLELTVEQLQIRRDRGDDFGLIRWGLLG